MTCSIEELNIVSLILRMLIATLLGGVIGLERGASGQSAGIRTFALVCVGAAGCAIVNLYLFYTTGSADTARIPSTVISGIGFLGVGTIVVTGKNYVRGLTTAATLWSTAVLGLLVGSGFIAGSFICFLTIMFIVVVLNKASMFQEEIASKFMMYLELDREAGIEHFLEYMNSHGYDVSVLEKQNASIHVDDIGLLVSCNIHKHKSHTNLINDLFTLDSVHYVEEIKA